MVSGTNCEKCHLSCHAIGGFENDFEKSQKKEKKNEREWVKNYCTDLKGQIDEYHTTIALMLNHISPCQNILKCSLSVTFLKFVAVVGL